MIIVINNQFYNRTQNDIWCQIWICKPITQIVLSPTREMDALTRTKDIWFKD